MRVFVRLRSIPIHGEHKGWWRLVSAIDRSKTNGFAIQGDFLNAGEHQLAVGTILVAKMPTGEQSGPPYRGVAYKVDRHGQLEELLEIADWQSQFMALRDVLAKETAAQSPQPGTTVKRGNPEVTGRSPQPSTAPSSGPESSSRPANRRPGPQNQKQTTDMLLQNDERSLSAGAEPFTPRGRARTPLAYYSDDELFHELRRRGRIN